MRQAFLIAVLAFLPGALRAQEWGAFTLMEGPVRVLRGATVFRGVEGMRFQNGDIVETGTPGFVQVEFSGGTIAAIGPATRVWIHGGSAGRDLALMSGWVKGETTPGGGTYRFVGPLLSATARGGAVIVHAGSGTAEIYIESGSASISAAESGGGKTVAAKAGQFFTRRAGKNLTVASRPEGAFVDAMPRPFRDTLPSRMSRFAGKKAPEPKLDHEITYAEAEPWLKLSRGWRRSFSERFQSRLKDAEFRKSVEQHIAEYPEWDRILHPEKYENSPSAPNGASTPPTGSY